MRTRVLLTGCLGAAVPLVFIADQFSHREPAPTLAPVTATALGEGYPWPAPAPVLGEPAPPFALPPVGGGADVTLASFHGRPVILLFGSFSCDVFCGQFEQVRHLVRGYEGRVEFVFVYVRDAGHKPPTTGPFSRYELRLPERDRRRLIDTIWRDSEPPGPCLYGTETSVVNAYHAFPQRLVLVDPSGRVAFDAGGGLPGGWDLEAVRKHLDTLGVTGAE